MMRRHLAGDAHAARLPIAHGVERLARAHVRDVHRAARQLGERDVAQRHDRFGFARDAAQAERRRMKSLVRDAVALERLLLAVLDDRHLEHAGVFERTAHQQRRRHRPSIVGERDAARLPQLRDVRELLPRLPARHRADRIHAGEVRLRRLLQDVFRDAGVVVHRHRVRHARDGREAAGHGGRGAGRHSFLVLLPRLAQMYMHVDQAGTHDEAARHLDHGRARVGRQIAANARDAIAVDQHVERPVAPVGGIDDAPALQQPFRR